jgi:hypothetical protein
MRVRVETGTRSCTVVVNNLYDYENNITVTVDMEENSNNNDDMPDLVESDDALSYLHQQEINRARQHFTSSQLRQEVKQEPSQPSQEQVTAAVMNILREHSIIPLKLDDVKVADGNGVTRVTNQQPNSQPPRLPVRPPVNQAESAANPNVLSYREALHQWAAAGITNIYNSPELPFDDDDLPPLVDEPALSMLPTETLPGNEMKEPPAIARFKEDTLNNAGKIGRPALKIKDYLTVFATNPPTQEFLMYAETCETFDEVSRALMGAYKDTVNEELVCMVDKMFCANLLKFYLFVSDKDFSTYLDLLERSIVGESSQLTYDRKQLVMLFTAFKQGVLNDLIKALDSPNCDCVLCKKTLPSQK